MAELADAQDLGSCAARLAGSNPASRTNTLNPPSQGNPPSDCQWSCQGLAGHTREFAGRVPVFGFDKEMFGNEDKKGEKAVTNNRPVFAEFRTDLPEDE